MPAALLVIDAQRSFMHRPYWSDAALPGFLAALQGLIDRCEARVPVVQIFHAEDAGGVDNAFSRQSGFVTALPGLRIAADEVFYKSVHSAMFGRNAAGRSLEEWLRDLRVDRLIVSGIRTEQCCETTTRHASDLGFEVSYAMDATMTFPMVAKSGRTWSANELKERTELVLADRFAQVLQAEAVSV